MQMKDTAKINKQHIYKMQTRDSQVHLPPVYLNKSNVQRPIRIS